MFGSIGIALARLIQSTSNRNQPWQIASAVALGTACGLMVNSTPAMLVTLVGMYFFPIHLPLALLVACGVAQSVPALAPLAGQLGEWALNNPPVLAVVSRLAELPLVPWLRLNNTVVHGCTLLAVIQLLPTFIAILPIARRLKRCELETGPSRHSRQPGKADSQDPDRIQEQIPSVSYMSIDLEDIQSELASQTVGDASPNRLAEPLLPNPWHPTALEPTDRNSTDRDHANENHTNRSKADRSEAELEAPLSSRSQYEDSPSLEDPETSDQWSTPIARVETFLADCSDAEINDLESRDVAARASELASLVDEMLVALDEEDALSSPKPDPLSALPRQTRQDQAHGQPADFPHQEPSSGPRSSTSNVPRPWESSPDDFPNHQGTNKTIHSLNEMQPDITRPSPDYAGLSDNHHPASPALRKQHSSHHPAYTPIPLPTTPPVTSPHEEALRYLLHHLKESKDKV